MPKYEAKIVWLACCSGTFEVEADNENDAWDKALDEVDKVSSSGDPLSIIREGLAGAYENYDNEGDSLELIEIALIE